MRLSMASRVNVCPGISDKLRRREGFQSLKRLAGVSSGAVELSGGSPCPFLIRRPHVRRTIGVQRDGGQQNSWRDNARKGAVKKRTLLSIAVGAVPLLGFLGWYFGLLG
jgi:hypothetical protein